MWCVQWVGVLAMVAVVSADASLRHLVEKLTAKLDAVESQQKQQASELSQLQKELQNRQHLQNSVASMRHELRQLTDHVRVQTSVGDNLAEMRSEIEDMSREIRSLKESNAAAAAPPPEDSPDHTLVTWLKDMVTMLKGQVADLAESFNTTAIIQLQQNADSRYSLLEGDVRALEDSVQDIRAHCRSDAGQLKQLRTDLVEVLAKSQQQGGAYSHLLDEVSNLRQELLYVPLKDHASASVAESEPTKTPHRRHQRRHHRHHRGHSRCGPFEWRSVEHFLENLRRHQSQLKQDMQTARKNVTSLQQQQTSLVEKAERAESRLAAVEHQYEELAWKINATDSRDSLSLREVQTSGRQLIREVEELETKVDSRLAEVQTQVARLDVSQAALRTSVAQVVDEQKLLPVLKEKIAQEMAAVSQRQDLDRTSLLTLQSDMLEYALDRRSADRPAS